METRQQFIGGEWRATAESIPVLSSSDRAIVARIARGTAADVDAAVFAGQAARAGAWGRLDATASSRLLCRDAENLARVESEDVGKPPTLARNDLADTAETIVKGITRNMANGTPYGLCAGVWTDDVGPAPRLAHTVQSGQVFIDNCGAGGGVERPFDGVKRPGHGREKGFEALHGSATLKTIVLRQGV